jgi:glycosyltransferase involved in cell wall biosynthesis
MMPPHFSLIVSTLGRSTPLDVLFASLAAQDWPRFEVIVVDQNCDDRLALICAPARWPFPLLHLNTPGERGAGRGRNAGARHARGDVLLFPDDDCWYPPTLLSNAARQIGERGCDMLAGRAADAAGRGINGRYHSVPVWIGRRNVWTTQIEWMVFIRRSAFEAVGGYDEAIGVGAATPWGACEGQDITLRLLAAGGKAFYDPALYGHHRETDTRNPGPDMVRKARSYARGMGYVLSRHGFGAWAAAYWVARSAASALLHLVCGRAACCRYKINTAIGRWEGFTQRCWSGTGAGDSSFGQDAYPPPGKHVL